MKIQTSGEKLTAEQKSVITNAVAGYHFANHTQSLELNLKVYDRTGKRVKWVANGKASTDFGFFTAEAIDWQLNLAVKAALGKLEEQAEKAKSRSSY